MDTWLKKLMRNRFLKWFVKVGIYVTTFVIILSIVGMIEIPEQESYFDSTEFRELFVKKAGYVRDWIVRYDEEKIFSEVTQEQIDRFIENSGKEMTEQEAVEGILADRRNYYSTIQNELVLTNKNLDYFAIDVTTGRYLTNMEGSSTEEMMRELTNRSNYLIGNGYYILNLKYGSPHQISYYSDQYAMDMNYYAGEVFEGQSNYRIYMALKEKLIPGDDFYVGYHYAISYEKQKSNFYNMCVSAVILDIVLLIYWVLVTEYGEETSEDKERKGKYSQFDKLPIEVQLAIAGLGVMLYLFSIGFMIGTPSPVMNVSLQGIRYKTLGIILFFVLSMIPTLLELAVISSWVRHIKSRTFLEQMWGYRLARDLYTTAGSKTKTTLIIILVIMINSLVDYLIFSLGVRLYFRYYFRHEIVAWIFIIGWNLLGGVFLIKLLVDYRKIFKVAKAITEGELDRKVELGPTLPMFDEMAQTVNSMGDGLEKAVGESIKSERLKTELITNVSHDLKTPLTSIISYIDLLKGENIENKMAKEYINVLDERSHRLKQLVEDLVEASKAVTGNLKADIQILRFDELIGQALGEYQDRLELAGLMVVTDKMEEVYAYGDGRHMWRVIENLLSNVCKYAMPHTRVYIEVYSKDHYGYCTIKNISKEALNIDPNELTERFVRGDASRTTEGSGLGLAIAQSLLILQQGMLEITIDGDLFKVTVKVPKAEMDELLLQKTPVEEM